MPEFGLRVFLPVGRDGKWVSYWDIVCFQVRYIDVT
jgi:hypothetical protein